MDEARLAAWLGPGTRIRSLALLSGGAIQQNWALAVTHRGRDEDWVLRTDNPGTLAVSLTRPQEYALLRAAWEAGCAVAEPLRLCEDPAVVGAPFFLMRRLPGTAAGHVLAKQARSAGGDPALVRALGAALARIHRIRPPRDGLGFLRAPPADPARAFVAWMRQRLDAVGIPRPVLEWGLEAMARLAPPPGPVVLCHNDFRTGNLMVADGQLSGVLDWEFCQWGDPHEDLGWFCAPCWRFGNRALEAGGLGPRGAFLAGYAAEAGWAPDPGRVAYWELGATIRWAVIAADQAQRVLSGAESSLELALTAHIIPELELDILEHCEALERQAAHA
ncbi:MAG: phosphotransferase family protein [Acetobacteraceae bacterium]|nr:phosphotransferase family protein [Acetobacteraceae bacterium]